MFQLIMFLMSSKLNFSILFAFSLFNDESYGLFAIYFTEDNVRAILTVLFKGKYGEIYNISSNNELELVFSEVI